MPIPSRPPAANACPTRPSPPAASAGVPRRPRAGAWSCVTGAWVRLLTLLALLLLPACRASVAGSSAKAAPPPPPTAGYIERAAAPPTIDGRLDDACWQKAQVVRADFRFDSTGRRDPQPRLNARYLWDEHYLYIAYEVFDANLIALPTGSPQGPPDNRRLSAQAWAPDDKIDLAEFMIAFEGFTNPSFFWEVQHNAANHLGDVLNLVPDPASPLRWSSMVPAWGRHFLFYEEFIQDDGPYRVAMAVRLKPRADGEPSSVNNPRDVDTGYTAEIRLPWRGLGAPTTWRVAATQPGLSFTEAGNPLAFAMAGKRVQILAAMLQGDGPEPLYFHSSPTLVARRHFAPSIEHWPTYELRGPAGP